MDEYFPSMYTFSNEKKEEEIMFVHRVEKLAIINSKSYLFLNMYILQVFALKNKSKEPLIC